MNEQRKRNRSGSAASKKTAGTAKGKAGPAAPKKTAGAAKGKARPARPTAPKKAAAPAKGKTRPPAPKKTTGTTKSKAKTPAPKKTAAPAKGKAKPPAPKKKTATSAKGKPKPAAPKKKAVAAKTKAKAKPARPAFPRGSWGVDPSHGPGKITGSETQVIAGQKVEFLTVEFAREKMSLKIPKDRIKESGLRPISSQQAIRTAMNKLKEPAHVKRSMWSRRAQEYENKLHSGDLVQIAEVLRDLYRPPEGPEQSFSERELYKDALDRFSREISAAENVPIDQACTRLESALRKTG